MIQRSPSDDQHHAPAGLSRRRLGALAAGGAAALGGAALGAGALTPQPGRAQGTEPPQPQAAVGYVLAHEQFPTPALVCHAVCAEQAGFSHVWTSDHSQPWQDNQGHAMFPWLTLALIGDHTSQLWLGTGVTCPSYRHDPSQVAQAFASLGVLSPGRVFLGVGSGEGVNELAATGRFGRYPERHDRLAEAIQLIRTLWTGKRTTFRGRFYQTDQFKLYDLPREPVPIYVAAAGPRSAYLAGQLGDGWIAQERDFTDPAVRVAFAAGALSVGKDPVSMPIYVEHFVVVGGQDEATYAAERWRFTADQSPDQVYQPDPVVIQSLAEQRVPLPEVYAQWTVGDDPAVHIRALQKIIALGGTPFVHSGQADQQRVIDFYGSSVLPHVHG
ncbi:F420-dependent hydroxymycolic acid dehydrogenase [Planosporangium sp. 12N6]|uniref:F420-dependent hydroxymycolic acid dehydrogenase n=1 Tax=Planosporangium spinosum TaxID=3402278 RepID=UPI003CE6CADB